MVAVTVGTETDGSIVCPSGNQLIVGLKPTLGLISQQGIIPIAHSQDTAGPMTRTVTDAAIMLNVLRSPFGPVAGHALPADYTAFLQRGALNGARIGVDRRQFLPEYFADPAINAVVETALLAMADAGAVLVDPVDTGDTFAWLDAEFTVLLYEFQHDIEAYLSTLRFGPSETRMRTLGDLIRFDIDHCPEEMRYFGQGIFELAEETGGDLGDPTYLDARALSLQLARDEGIDRTLREHDLDAVISPSYAFGSSAPAVAGYPDISIPVGLTDDGRPAGIWMYGGFLSEPTLLALAYDIEQTLQARTQPQFAGMPPEFPDAGICPVATKPGRRRRRRGEAFHPGSGRHIRGTNTPA
jgi:amidase